MKELLEKIKKCAQELEALNPKLEDGESFRKAFQLIQQAQDLKKQIDEYTR